MDLRVFNLYMSICKEKGGKPSYDSLVLFREGLKLRI